MTKKNYPNSALRGSILPSLTLMHNTMNAYILHITLFQWSKELAEFLHVRHVYATSAAQFRFLFADKIHTLAIPLTVDLH